MQRLQLSLILGYTLQVLSTTYIRSGLLQRTQLRDAAALTLARGLISSLMFGKACSGSSSESTVQHYVQPRVDHVQLCTAQSATQKLRVDLTTGDMQ